MKSKLVGISSVTLIGLIALCIAWEWTLAPMRPGGSWLVLKALPLVAAFRGVIHGRRYTYQWACLLACLYLCEGLTRSYTDPMPAKQLAVLETILSLIFLVSATLYSRATRPSAS